MQKGLVWSAVLACAVLSGCGDDDSVQPDPLDTGPIECEELSLPSHSHPEEIQVVAELPAGTGGALKDGDYELFGHVRYRSAAGEPNTSSMRAALRLRRGGTVMDYLYDERDPGEPESPGGFTARVTTNGNLLLLEMVCPERRTSTVGFSASGDQLSIIEDNEEMRFERR
jgi:hypothetical protein